MKFYKNNENRRSILSESFLSRMVQMRRCFFLKCTKGVHEEKNIKQMSRYAQETGRSMVEMLGVLAIIGVLSVGGIAGYSKAMFKHKVSQMLDTVSKAIAKLVELDSKNTKGDVDSSSAKSLGFDCEHSDLYPDRCKIPFGVYSYYLANGGDNTFMVQLDGYMSQAACVELLSSEFYKNVPEDWWYPNGHIYVYNNSGTEYFYGKSDEALALGAKENVTATDISRVCNVCRDLNDGIEPSCRVMFFIRYSA